MTTVGNLVGGGKPAEGSSHRAVENKLQSADVDSLPTIGHLATSDLTQEVFRGLKTFRVEAVPKNVWVASKSPVSLLTSSSL